MTLDAALLVRTASAVLWLLLGLLVIVVGRRSADGRLLGAMAAAFGLPFLWTNLVLAGVRIPVALVVLANGLALTLPLAVAWRAARGDRTALAVAAAGTVAAVLLFFLRRGEAEAFDRVGVLVGLTGDELHLFRNVAIPLGGMITLAVLAAVLGVRAGGAGGDRARGAGALVVLAFGLYGPYSAGGSSVGGVTPGLSEPLVLLAWVAAAACWLAASVRTGGRRERNVALLILGAGLAGMLGPLSFDPLRGGVGNLGVGVLRLVGLALFATAVLRYDLLGVPLPRLAVRSGPLAAAALATLFIVAQVAQEFFAAQYGLLMGGVVAGALFFAAAPVHRALERLSQPENASRFAGRTGSGSDRARREDLYRSALRIALVDRRVSREEELHLFELAEELGIGAGRAMQLRQEVERETGQGVP